jgi:hypothetical protein
MLIHFGESSWLSSLIAVSSTTPNSTNQISNTGGTGSTVMPHVGSHIAVISTVFSGAAFDESYISSLAPSQPSSRF